LIEAQSECAALGRAAPRPLRCGLEVDTLRRTLGTDLTAPDAALREMVLAEAA